MDRPKSLPEPAQEGNGIGDRFLLSSERVKEVRRTMEGLVDPLGVVAPLAHANAAWLMHPQDLAERQWLHRRPGCLAGAYPGHAGRPGQRRRGAPQPDDTRFADPVWTREPGWDLLKQWYLFYTRHVQDALYQTPGLAPKERRRAAFWWRKWLNAIAPTNFL